MSKELIRRLDRAVINFNRGTEDLRPLLTLASTALGERRSSALEWAAGKVEAAGCLCEHLWLTNNHKLYDGQHLCVGTWGGVFTVIKHDSRCPVALAAEIREGLS